MKQWFRLYRRKNGGRFYLQDSTTGKQESLGTADRAEALRVLHARNEAERQPAMNLQIARAYLVASDPQFALRDWQHVMNEVARQKKGVTQGRWTRAMREKPFDKIRAKVLIETKAQDFLDVLAEGGVCTNIFLRRLHNYALDNRGRTVTSNVPYHF
jgi:hypothetical protein